MTLYEAKNKNESKIIVIKNKLNKLSYKGSIAKVFQLEEFFSILRLGFNLIICSCAETKKKKESIIYMS